MYERSLFVRRFVRYVFCRLRKPLPRRCARPKDCLAADPPTAGRGRRRAVIGVLRTSAGRPRTRGPRLRQVNPHAREMRFRPLKIAPTTPGASRKTRQRKKTDGFSIRRVRPRSRWPFRSLTLIVPALRPPRILHVCCCREATTDVTGASRYLPGTRHPAPGPRRPRGRSARAKRREGLRLLNARHP